MNTPRTLLEMSGAAPRPVPLAHCAVVIIDAQREYVDGALPLDGVGAALDQAARLVAMARDAGRPVIHIVHKGRPGGAFDPAGSGFTIAEQVAPAGGETVIEKNLPNAFARTDLAETLGAVGAKAIIVGGFMTHMCVSSTVRAALDHGLFSTVVAAACATRALPGPDGGTISAAEIQRAELAALADRFALVVPDAGHLG